MIRLDHDSIFRPFERRAGHALAAGALLVAITASAGCLSERSFQMRANEVRLATADTKASLESTRDWLRRTHRQLSDLLPSRARTALLTDNMTVAGDTPVDVFDHFGLKRSKLQSIFGNWDGIRCTAQTASRNSFIDIEAPQWPGFENAWIPVGDDLRLSARIGLARDGETAKEADAIVLLPGLFGDHGVLRTRDLAFFLRDAGFHVVSLEIRGHGQTEHRYPDACHTFGVLETDELMLVSDWLVDKPYVKRTGLVGFCWSGNLALLAAWYDGRTDDDPAILPPIARNLQAHPESRPRFEAGVIAFSSILRWEELVDLLDTPRSTLREPIYTAIQDTVRTRATRKDYEPADGNLRRLISNDFKLCGPGIGDHMLESYSFLRLMPYRDRPWHDKLERARVPVLVVHGCDDPLAPSQDLADFMATISNPKVAGLIIPGGGHVGFAAYAKSYYFNLILNFFQPPT